MVNRALSVKTQVRMQLRLERIDKAIAKARSGNLWSVGYLISTIAKGEIKRSKRKSQPGYPPKTRKGLLRRAIRYRVVDDHMSVVIGPVASQVGRSGEAQEFGGEYKRAIYPARPFMGPALAAALPRIGPGFKSSIGT